MPEPETLPDLRSRLYTARAEAVRLRRELHAGAPAAHHGPWRGDPEPGRPSEARLAELIHAEANLAALEAQISQAQAADPAAGLLLRLGSRGEVGVLGAETTRLEAAVHLRMAHVSTAMVHLLSAADSPLLSCEIRNFSNQTRRIRITSFVEGYSARAVTTIEIPPGPAPLEIKQLPTFFPHALRELHELTRATLNVLVEELGEGGARIESHSTHPIWLLARNTAPLAVRDPMTAKWVDLSRYLGAFVTPNAPELLAFLNQAAELHPQKQLAGYQGDAAQVEAQVRAIFEALKTAANIRYINSIIAFAPGENASNQRVRLPRESLQNRQANCIDGVVLYASLLEAISLNPALVIIPGHAFLGWQSWKEPTSSWNYLETTMTANHSYDEARARGDIVAKQYRKLAEATPIDGQPAPHLFRQWSMRQLRSELGITPLE